MHVLINAACTIASIARFALSRFSWIVSWLQFYGNYSLHWTLVLLYVVIMKSANTETISCSLKSITNMFLICANGCVNEHEFPLQLTRFKWQINICLDYGYERALRNQVNAIKFYRDQFSCNCLCHSVAVEIPHYRKSHWCIVFTALSQHHQPIRIGTKE